MKSTLYLPYYDYNDGTFDIADDYYSSGEYSKKIEDEYNKSKDIVYNSMLDYNNGNQNVFMGMDGQTYKFTQKDSQSYGKVEDKVSYSSCESVIYDSEGDDLTVDMLITHFARQESFICILRLDMDSAEEEFETEMSLWGKEHRNINEYKDKISDEWVWVNEPKRNIKMKFINNGNETLYGVLENCKMIDRAEYCTFVIYVEKMRLVDKI